MRRPGREEWLRLVSEYERSGLQQKEFVAKHDVSLSSFQYWLYKQTRSASKFEVNPKQRFLPVEVVGSPAPAARVTSERLVELAVRGALVLRFTVGTDTRYVAELVAALG